MQVLALLAMEQPVTMSADDIRDEKVKVRRALAAFPFTHSPCKQSTLALALSKPLKAMRCRCSS